MLSANSEVPDVTFVVPCFKSRDTIGNTLNGIYAQNTELTFEVIVIESSQDSTKEWLQTVFPRVDILASQVRLSPGAARNLGAKHARGSFLAFLDADTAPAADWLERLLNKMNSTPEIRVTGGAVDIGNPESLSARILHWIEFSEFVKGTPSGLRSHLSSSNLLVRKLDFLEAGGFDESFVMAEDLLLSRSFPGALFFEGSTSIGHYYRSTWSRVVGHLNRLGFWSGQLRGAVNTNGSILKWFPPASFLLPPFRTVLVIWRVWRSNRVAGLQAFAHSPLILAALFHWAAGFYRGLKQKG